VRDARQVNSGKPRLLRRPDAVPRRCPGNQYARGENTAELSAVPPPTFVTFSRLRAALFSRFSDARRIPQSLEKIGVFVFDETRFDEAHDASRPSYGESLVRLVARRVCRLWGGNAADDAKRQPAKAAICSLLVNLMIVIGSVTNRATERARIAKSHAKVRRE